MLSKGIWILTFFTSRKAGVKNKFWQRLTSMNSGVINRSQICKSIIEFFPILQGTVVCYCFELPVKIR